MQPRARSARHGGSTRRARTRDQHPSPQPDDLDYAPVAGVWELREAVAGLYNKLFRRGMKSQYSAENVCIAGGGRVAVMRACAAIAPIHLGHFLPDYTAYEELLDVFRRFLPIPILLDPKQGYEFSREQLEEEILGRGLSAILASNPCNPTGKAVQGDALASWMETARDLNCALLARRILFALRVGWGPVDRQRGTIRRGRRQGPHHRVRRAHEELALPRLPSELDRGPEASHRVGRKRWLVPRWRWGCPDAAGGDRPRPRRTDARRDEGCPSRVPEEAGLSREESQRHWRAVRPRAPGHLLCLGRSERPAGVASQQRRFLQGGSRTPGHLRAGALLRRESGQAPDGQALAFRRAHAVLVRAPDARPRAGRRAAPCNGGRRPIGAAPTSRN